MSTARIRFYEWFVHRVIGVGPVLALLLPTWTIAQGTLSTILSNGPTAKRINIVVLSEGYTTNQLSQFLVDATNAVNNLLGQQPYQEYRSFFNAFAIWVASVQSGSDHPNYPLSVDTYFNSVYESGDYVITIPPNSLDPNPAHGQGKVNALLTSLLPECDFVVVLVNDLTPGGSGGSGGTKQVITALNVFYPYSDIIVHESGHAFGDLADEYDSPFPGYTPTEKPNATTQTNRNSIKWTAWIATNTPLPTPETAPYANIVGLFEGAQYQGAGWYRPKLDCKMNHLGVGYCEVCSEQLVKSIYTLVRPIDSFLPASTNVFIYSTQAVAFSVSSPQPLTHDLATQWFTNNVAVSGATNPTFALTPGWLGNGGHSLRVVVSDPTALVRNDPSGLLKQTNAWTLNVSLTDLTLTSARYLGGDRFRLTITGTAPQGFVLQASTNLLTWTPLLTNSLVNGKFDYTNLHLTNLPRRFYRTLSPP